MNSAAVKDPPLVKEAVKQFGSDRITVAIDGRRNKAMVSGFELVVSGGTRPVGKDAVLWAKECQDLGAGAVLPTSMDADGTKDGYDLPFTRAVANAVTVPVIASGGAGTLEHFYQGVTEVSPTVLANARMLGAGRNQLLRHVYLPSATSWVFSSLHTSVGLAFVGAVVGEYLGSSRGVGYLILQAEGTFDINTVMAGILVLTAFALVLDWAVGRVESHLMRWQPRAGETEKL